MFRMRYALLALVASIGTAIAAPPAGAEDLGGTPGIGTPGVGSRFPTEFDAYENSGGYRRAEGPHDMVHQFVSLDVYGGDTVHVGEAQFSCRSWGTEPATECHLIFWLLPGSAGPTPSRYAASGMVDLESLQRGEQQTLQIFDATGRFDTWVGGWIYLKPVPAPRFPSQLVFPIHPRETPPTSN